MSQELKPCPCKHTPGPWEWDGTVWDYDKEQDAPWLVQSKNHAQLVILDGEIRARSEADARLIAAAPELFEALDETLKTLLAWIGHYSDREPSDLPAVVNAIAAIAKATGEQA